MVFLRAPTSMSGAVTDQPEPLVPFSIRTEISQHDPAKESPRRNSAFVLRPLTIRGVTLKNRLVVSPMCLYSARDGFPNDWHFVHLGSRAVGGAGLVFTGAVAISPQGRATHCDLGVWKDEHIEPLARIVKFIHEQGCVAGIQLGHAGRKASMTRPWEGDRPLTEGEQPWAAMAPSPVPARECYPRPPAMSTKEIGQSISEWKKATQRAARAGFQVLEIHAGHGFLIHQFLCQSSNQRADDYGGSFDNRIRYCIEVAEAVRSVWPMNLPLFFRISASDWFDGGWTLSDSVKLASKLKAKGVDLIDCSSGGMPKSNPPSGSTQQVKLAETVKKQAGILTGAVGEITTARECENIVRENNADLVFCGRAFLRDPFFARRVADDLDDPMRWPGPYSRAGGYKVNEHK